MTDIPCPAIDIGIPDAARVEIASERATRKPMLPVALSGVLELRAPTR